MAKLTEKQRGNRRDRLVDDAMRGIERRIIQLNDNDMKIDLKTVYDRKQFVLEIIEAIERCHVISERRLG